MFQENHIYYMARRLAMHNRQPAWLFQLGIDFVSLLCLVSLLARVSLVGIAPPLAADAHAGAVFLLALLLYGVSLDVVATLGVAAFMLVARALLGPSYGQAQLGPALGLWLPLLLLIGLNLPALIRAMRVPFSSDGWLLRLLKALHNVALGSIYSVALLLLNGGYRPELKAKLQAEARRQRFRRERLHWRNWGHTAECRPQVAFLPETLADLTEIMTEARASQRRVRVVATGHSWPALSVTNDILVITHRLDKVTVDLRDPQRPLLIAEAGATNQQMNAVLAQHGLTLPFNVVLESVRIGGLVATGSHGSGWDMPTLSDLVEAIEIVNAAGELICYRAETHGPQVMNAVRVSLGLFGLIYRVHLRVQPNYRVHQCDVRLPLAVMRQQIAALVPTHEALDLYYWPYQEVVTVRMWDRTDAPSNAAPTRNTWQRRLSHSAFAVFHAWEHVIMRTWPKTVPAIAAFNYRWFPHHNRVTDVVEAVHWRDAIEMLRVSCVEFAFQLDADLATFQQAWQDALDVIDDFAAQGRYPFNMTLNARFIKSSDCLLAPALGPGHVCYIEILSSAETPHWQEFASAIALRWMKLPGARPHWAKEWEFIPGIEAFIGRAYAVQLKQFHTILEALGVDPERRFSNALLDRVIFGHAAVAPAQTRPSDVAVAQAVPFSLESI